MIRPSERERQREPDADVVEPEVDPGRELDVDAAEVERPVEIEREPGVDAAEVVRAVEPDPADPDFEQLLRRIASAPAASPERSLAALADRSRLEGLSGRVMGQFRFDERLGAGAMGVVYRAYDYELDRAVALKLILPRPGRIGDRTQALSEARAAAAVSHAGLATVYSVGEMLGCAYIAMEYVPGEPLRRRIGARPLPAPLALSVARGVTDALATAHRGGVVHRDLKPDNVLLTPDGVAKIVDFGIADRQTPSGSRRERLVVAGGTEGYIAPEQRAGAPADPRADVYSLGIVLLETLSGQHVHPAGVEQALRQLSRRFSPELSARLVALITRCLEPEPDARYRSAEEVAGELREVVEGLGGVDASGAGRPGAEEVDPRRSKTRARGSWRIVAGLAAAAAGVAALVGPPASDPAPTPVRATAHSSSSPRAVAGPPSLRLERITARPRATSPSYGALSPDGLDIAYLDHRGVVLHTLDTGAEAVTAAPAGAVPSALSWFPDGRRVVVSMTGADGRGGSWVVDLVDARWERIASQRYFDVDVSPDGMRLAGATGSATWIVDLRPGVAPVSIADVGVASVRWSPDGHRLAMVRFERGSASLEVLDTRAQPATEPRVVLRDPRLYLRNSVAGIDWRDESSLWVALWERDGAAGSAGLWALDLEAEHPAPGAMTRVATLSDSIPHHFTYRPASRSMSFVAMQSQTDVVTLDLSGAQGGSPTAPVRLTLQDWNEYPSGWDERGVLFTGQHRGRFIAYAQPPGAEARALARDVTWPRATSDGGLLGWHPSPEATELVLLRGDERQPLMTVPTAFEGLGDDRPPPATWDVRCARRAPRCLVSESRDHATVFWDLDLETGRRTYFAEHRTSCSHGLCWDVSADGRRLALADERSVRIAAEGLGSTPRFEIDGCEMTQGVGWSPDSRSLFVSAAFCAPSPVYRLLRVDRATGATTLLYGADQSWLAYPVSSPDGARLAFARKSFDMDLWVARLD